MVDSVMTDWKHVDDDGVEWCEYPHAHESHCIVTWGTRDNEYEISLNRYEPTLSFDGFGGADGVATSVVRAVVERAEAWIEEDGLPPGTRVIRPKKKPKGRKGAKKN
jgi:hypothetical protein